MPRTARWLAGLAAGVTLATLLPLSSPAAATATGTSAALSAAASRTDRSATGLFGTQDPTYDGVYRQAMAILGLRAVGAAVPALSVPWLAAQQCPDGGFQAYRAAGAACQATDLTAFTGEDTNSTGLAAMALDRVGRSGPAARAIAWLRRAQNADGGWGYLRGAASDANSTGLVMTALRAAGIPPSSVRRAGRSGLSYLASVTLGCGAPVAVRGALAYQAGTGGVLAANTYASAQAGVGLTTGLPVARRAVSASEPRLSCRGSQPDGRTGPADAVAGYLARSLRAGGGLLPSALGEGTDQNATAWAVLALAGAGRGRAAISGAVAALRRTAPAFVRDDAGQGRPAALGTLLLVAQATGQDPRRFGGQDLVRLLRATAT